jgi:endonuclease/exonuclease/phosphatase family metal-dependent hydrolase
VRRATVLALLLAGAAGVAGAGDRVTIGSWNMEWMMTPATFDALAPACAGPGRRVGGSERNIPCNLVPASRWSDADLARIRAFAATLPLDVIALQETDGADAAARIFPDREFCFTRRVHVQNVGFAIRRGVPFRCHRDFRALGLPDNDVRWGADLTIHPGTPHEIRLLAVHLKASCNRDPLTNPRDDCRKLQQQVPILEEWIDRQARNGKAFAVIGDFNRRFDREQDSARDAQGRIVAMWPEIDDGEPADADLTDAGADHGPVGCNARGGTRMPIDHLVFGRKLASRLVGGSFRSWDYPAGGRWPDHCVISVELDLGGRDAL